MSETLKNAILNGLYDQKYRGHEFLNPQLLEMIKIISYGLI